MKGNNNQNKGRKYRIRRKDNGDIYNYEPIVGYDVPLYETEVADVPIFENPAFDQRLGETLDERINNNPE